MKVYSIKIKVFLGVWLVQPQGTTSTIAWMFVNISYACFKTITTAWSLAVAGLSCFWFSLEEVGSVEHLLPPNAPLHCQSRFPTLGESVCHVVCLVKSIHLTPLDSYWPKVMAVITRVMLFRGYAEKVTLRVNNNLMESCCRTFICVHFLYMAQYPHPI